MSDTKPTESSVKTPAVRKARKPRAAKAVPAVEAPKALSFPEILDTAATHLGAVLTGINALRSFYASQPAKVVTSTPALPKP